MKRKGVRQVPVERIPKSSRTPEQRAEVFAIRLRKALPYHPQGDVILFKDLKGKPVEYVDKEQKIRIKRCVAVDGYRRVKLRDHINGKEGKPVERWVRRELVVGAYYRKGSKHRLEVVY